MNKLNKFFLAGIALLFSLSVMGANLSNYANPDKDTVILKFGNNSQIVVYIDSKEDLDNLTNYDINKILEDLNLQVNNLNDSVQVLEIKDETGKKYLKDTSVVYQVEPRYSQEDNDDKEKRKFKHGSRTRFDHVLDVGLNNFMEDGEFANGNEVYSLNPLGSWYWNFGPNLRAHLLGPLFIDLGISAALNVHNFDNARTRLSTDATGVNFNLDNSPTISPKKSKLSTWHIQAKAIPMFAFSSSKDRSYRLWNKVDKGFRFGAGLYAGYRIWSRTKYVYKVDGNKNKDKNNAGYLLSNFRYGIRGQVGIRGVDFFFEYDINEMFQANQGAPALNRMQFGITF